MPKKPLLTTPVVVPTAQALALSFPPRGALEDISTLAARQIELEDRIARGQALLADLNERLNEIRQTDLPLAMASAGLINFSLADGSGVEISDFIAANIKEENKARAFKWLRSHKYGSLIKNVVSVAFGMGEDQKAAQIIELLKKKKVPVEQKESVHSSTLRAFVRESLAEGRALPPEIDVISVPTTKITRPTKE